LSLQTNAELITLKMFYVVSWDFILVKWGKGGDRLGSTSIINFLKHPLFGIYYNCSKICLTENVFPQTSTLALKHNNFSDCWNDVIFQTSAQILSFCFCMKQLSSWFFLFQFAFNVVSFEKSKKTGLTLPKRHNYCLHFSVKSAVSAKIKIENLLH